jgi:GNAT superfamily N-acetyltransferase
VSGGFFGFFGCGTGSGEVARKGGWEEEERGGERKKGKMGEEEFFFWLTRLWCFGRLLAPLWVVPEYQGCGVTSLLREVIGLADRYDPPQPMYLEAMPAARPVYGHFGWRGGGERVCYSEGSGGECGGEITKGGGVIGWLVVIRWGWKDGKRREVVVLFCTTYN